MAKMNPQVKAKWVAALRSGEYKQGRGQLRSEDHFCCLGVLCNLHAQKHPKVAAQELERDVYLGEIEILPPLVTEWAGLPDKWGGYVLVDGENRELPELNDEGCSFADLAKLIEAQL